MLLVMDLLPRVPVLDDCCLSYSCKNSRCHCMVRHIVSQRTVECRNCLECAANHTSRKRWSNTFTASTWRHNPSYLTAASSLYIFCSQSRQHPQSPVLLLHISSCARWWRTYLAKTWSRQRTFLRGEKIEHEFNNAIMKNMCLRMCQKGGMLLFRRGLRYK